ncbi:hypothetical protein [Streptomyces sp. WZ.A104]|uniref:hypothetical protein n=1 Tax=Streptomyces sp. WZ.A104 TaxID=2023771 RepID=UPI00117F722D|nr:hypothetical protein [Streptomyces sp. WZ.A104]
MFDPQRKPQRAEQTHHRRIARTYPVAIFATIMAMSGCITSSEPQNKHTTTATCRGGEFEWDISTSWRLTVLDEAKIVEAGSEMVADSIPFKTRKSEARSTQGTLSSEIVFEELEKHLKKKVAEPGTSTASEKRVMGAHFPERGQGVYFRGVKQISGTYTFTCPHKAKENKGTVFTWETKSSTTGLADCLLGPDGNSKSELSKMAITSRCPKGTPARAVLNDSEQADQ